MVGGNWIVRVIKMNHGSSVPRIIKPFDDSYGSSLTRPRFYNISSDASRHRVMTLESLKPFDLSCVSIGRIGIMIHFRK